MSSVLYRHALTWHTCLHAHEHIIFSKLKRAEVVTSCWSACLAFLETWAPSLALHKLDMLEHMLFQHTEGGGRGSEVQDHPWQYSELEARLGDMRPLSH